MSLEDVVGDFIPHLKGRVIQNLSFLASTLRRFSLGIDSCARKWPLMRAFPSTENGSRCRRRPCSFTNTLRRNRTPNSVSLRLRDSVTTLFT